MKRLVVVSLVSLLVGYAVCAAGKVQAQERQRARKVISERIQDLNLTDEQETKIADIRKQGRPKVEGAAKQLAALLKEEVENVRDVLTVEQLDKLHEMPEMREERRAGRLAERLAHLEELGLTGAEVAKLAAIREDCRPKIVKALEGLKGTLTDEQRDAWEEARKAGKNRKEVIASSNLTNEQKAKVTAVGKEVATLIRQEMEKISDVLSGEQKEKLMELKEERHEHARDRLASAIANCKDLNLTDDQKSQIAAIRQEYRPKIHEAGNNLRAAVRAELAAIIAVLKG